MPTSTRPKPTPPTLVLFVRHGRTATTGTVLPGRAAGLHLADSGRAEADAVAARLDALKRIDAIYSSPLERARETAAPIAAARGLKVSTDKGLLECDFGRWTGAALKELARGPEWGRVQRYPSGFRFPEGESFREMATRVTGAAAKLRTSHPGQVVVAVSHADPIKAAVADALGLHLDLFQRIVISTCSVTAIAYGDDGPVVLTVNDSGNLAKLAPS
jgi:probable phosphomutase (TIGR03848 family)